MRLQTPLGEQVTRIHSHSKRIQHWPRAVRVISEAASNPSPISLQKGPGPKPAGRGMTRKQDEFLVLSRHHPESINVNFLHNFLNRKKFKSISLV